MAMAEPRQEPSMEDILASIKRIIADDAAVPAAEPAPPPARGRRSAADGPPSAAPVLELVERVPAAPEPAPPPPPPEATREAPAPEPEAPPATAKILSEQAAAASRQSLAALSALVVRPEGGSFASLEDLVREMLRPMLKEWLDARLPEIVERLVAREITRITGNSF